MYANEWITVREGRVIRSNGSKGIYGVVEARIANAVVALTAENEICLVCDLTFSEARPDETEEFMIKKVALAEAIELVESGKITDAFSIMAISLTERWLNRRG